MSSDEDTSPENSAPAPGPGVTGWLMQIIGPPRASKAAQRPPMPAGMVAQAAAPPAPPGRAFDVLPPVDVVVADNGELQHLEVRGLPDGASFNAGTRTDEGAWLLTAADIYGLRVFVPDDVDVPFSVMLKGFFIGEDADEPWSELSGFEIGAQEAETGSGDEIDESEALDEPAPAPAPEPIAPEPIAPSAAPEPAAPSAEEDSVSPDTSDTPDPEPDAEPESGPETKPEPEPEPESEPEPTAPSAPLTMVVVDLDVSVGTEDMDVLKRIDLRFSGLPDGAWLNAGKSDNGVWHVPATELSSLSIAVPEQTTDFDLDVEMEIDGGAPQSARIRVENTPQQIAPDSSFMIRLESADEAELTRFSVYADGVSAYDRVLDWRNADVRELEIAVPYIDDAMPFEILIRYEPLGNPMGISPGFAGLIVDGTEIAADSAAISAQGDILGGVLHWTGDLVVDVRHALRAPEGIPQPEPVSASQETSVPAEPTAAHLPSEVFETNAVGADDSGHDATHEPDEVLAPSAEPASDSADEPDEQPDTVIEDTGDHPAAAPDDEPQGERDVLVVEASFADLQRPAFLNELRGLRDFIRTQTDDATGEIYDRLGIDVTKWHDMVVKGPSGAEVSLEPSMLPRLAPRGGRDNTRDLFTLPLSDDPATSTKNVRVSGLPPGMLLSQGRNLGNGIWEIEKSHLHDVAALPPLGGGRTLSLRVETNSGDGSEDAPSALKSLLIGQGRPAKDAGWTDQCVMPLPLSPDVFDPDGHGSISLTIGDLPPGATLSKGRNHGGGVWTVELKTGEPLTLNVAKATPPCSATLTCVALDPASGASTVVSRVLSIVPLQSLVELQAELAA